MTPETMAGEMWVVSCDVFMVEGPSTNGLTNDDKIMSAVQKDCHISGQISYVCVHSTHSIYLYSSFEFSTRMKWKFLKLATTSTSTCTILVLEELASTVCIQQYYSSKFIYCSTCIETRITSTSAPKSTKSIALSEDVQQWRYRVYSLHSYLIIVLPTVSLCFSLGLS